MTLVATYTLDRTVRPMAIDWCPADGQPGDPPKKGIFRVRDDTLTICLAPEPESPRPATLESPKGSHNLVNAFTRVKKRGSNPPLVTESPHFGRQRPFRLYGFASFFFLGIGRMIVSGGSGSGTFNSFRNRASSFSRSFCTSAYSAFPRTLVSSFGSVLRSNNSQ